MADDLTLEMIEDALDIVAEWPIAAYGQRIVAVSLVIEGHYGPLDDCYGIVPITIARGIGPDGAAETRETLPTREVLRQAERLLLRLCPTMRLGTEVRNGR